MTDPERDALDVRPTADEMLARVRPRTPATAAAGCASISGWRPGVGKTYRMLEEGHRRLARGTDLVVGFVEAHGRPHTVELLDGLEVVPRRRIEYRGVVVEEMDTDAIIARDPTVALIDELAHTNVPGSPREKRWEDVEVDPRRRASTSSHAERPAPRQRRRRGRDDHRRARSTSACPDEVLLERRRDRARRHEPARPPPADEARQRLPARADAGRARQVLHRGEPDGAPGARPAARGATGRGSARGHDRRASSCRSSRSASWSSSTGARRRCERSGERRSWPEPSTRPSWPWSSRRPESSASPFDRQRDLQEAIDDAVDLGADVVRVEAADVADRPRAGRPVAPRDSPGPAVPLGARDGAPAATSAGGRPARATPGHRGASRRRARASVAGSGVGAQLRLQSGRLAQHEPSSCLTRLGGRLLDTPCSVIEMHRCRRLATDRWPVVNIDRALTPSMTPSSRASRIVLSSLFLVMAFGALALGAIAIGPQSELIGTISALEATEPAAAARASHPRRVRATRHPRSRAQTRRRRRPPAPRRRPPARQRPEPPNRPRTSRPTSRSRSRGRPLPTN